MEIKTNDAKNDVTSTVRLASPQDLQDLANLKEKTPNRQVREGGSKRFYIWRSIMKALTFYFRNLEPTQNLHRFILPFLTFMVDHSVRS